MKVSREGGEGVRIGGWETSEKGHKERRRKGA